MRKHFIYWLALGFVAITGCQKELSFEGGNTPAEGSLQSDVSGDCLPKTVNGIYEAALALTPATNTITVQVNVTHTGLYTIATDTVNGYYFRGTGTFTALGANTITLRSNGTPFAAGVNNFVVSFDSTICDIPVTVLPAGTTKPAVFAFAGAGGSCTGAVPAGTYTKDVALNSTNTVTISVNVTTIGTYNITTTFQGMTFAASGIFAATGAQTVTLNGSGTPSTSGLNTVPLTAGTSTCSFPVTVTTAAVGTLGATTGACSPSTINGTYIKDVILTAANTVQVQIDVTTAGTYNISTNTVAGMQFSGTGTVAVGPGQLITLNGTGTPTAAGPQTFTVTFGTSTCTFTITVGAAAVAAGTLGGATGACTPSTVNGTYTSGVALVAASNTVQVQINVTTAGVYNISTNTVAGMQFSGTGTVALGAGQLITLTGTGTPTATGAKTFTVTFGASTCTFTITVVAAGGVGAFTANCASAVPAGLYEATTQLNPSNTVVITVNVTAIGTYNIATVVTNGMIFSASGTFAALGNTNITLVGSGTPLSAGTSNIPMPGTTACTFPLVVDPVPMIDWRFTVTNAPATIYQGQTDAAVLQSPAPPVVIFALSGSNSAGTDNLTIALSDANGTIANGETYSTSALTGNAAIFSYDLATGTDTYSADPGVSGVTMTFTVTSHVVATKTIIGTFTGTAKNGAGQIITITNGTFTAVNYQ
jgi:hypothetical protein